MHIFLTADAYLPRAGGSRVYYHSLYRRLHAECGHRITVLTKHVPGWEHFDQENAAPGFRIVRRDQPLANWSYRRVQDLARPFAHTLSLIARERPAMLHAGDLYPQGLIALLAKRLFGLKYLAFCHGEEVTQMQKQRTEPRMRDLIYRHAERVICASAFARQTLLATGFPANRTKHITPGVDWARFRPGTPSRDLVERLGLESKLVLLTVARLFPRKGHARVLSAVAALARQHPNVCYVIAGTGPEEARLREKVRALGIEERVRFTGFVPDADLPDLYRASHVMVMPNFEEVETGDIEGFGMVFLEANAAGKPVVAGRSGGAAEPVADGQTGYLVDPLNTADLIATLDRLLSNRELRERLGRQGSERAQRDFDWSCRARQLSDCCLEIVHPRADPSAPNLERCKQRSTI